MSTIEQNLIGNTAGLSRVDKVLRYFFLALLIGTVVYSIGGTFFGKDNRLFAFKGVGGVGIPRSGGGSVGGSFGG